MNEIKKLGLRPPPGTSPTPSPAAKPQSETKPAAQPNDARPSFRQAPSNSGTQQQTFLPFSQSVKKMQEKMLNLAAKLSVSLPLLSAKSDREHNPNADKILSDVKRLNIDPNLIDKINSISKNITSPDGLWGPKTQEALNAINSYGKALLSELKTENKDIKESSISTILSDNFKTLFNLNKSGSVDYNDISNEAIKYIDALSASTDQFAEHIKNLPKQEVKPQETKQKEKLPDLPPPGMPADKVAPQSDQKNKEYQQVSQDPAAKAQITKVLQETSGSSQLVLPYDLNTDQFNFGRMRAFAHQVDSLMDAPAFISEMKFYLESLRNYDKLVQDTLADLSAIAPTPFKYGGFSININTDIEAFATASGSYLNAFNFLSKLVPLCQYINNTIRALYASPSVIELNGKDRLDAQIQKGTTYLVYLQKYIKDLRDVISRGGNK